jgi:hypothetical protein
MSQVRNRLAGGGKGIRTRGPPKCRYAKRIVCVERRPSPGIRTAAVHRYATAAGCRASLVGRRIAW